MRARRQASQVKPLTLKWGYLAKAETVPPPLSDTGVCVAREGRVHLRAIVQLGGGIAGLCCRPME